MSHGIFMACWVPVAMAQVTHYIPQQFVVQKYLSNTQIHPVCWLHTILHDCIILYEYPSNAATFFRLQLSNLVGSHGWASPSATFGQLDRVSCGATWCHTGILAESKHMAQITHKIGEGLSEQKTYCSKFHVCFLWWMEGGKNLSSRQHWILLL